MARCGCRQKIPNLFLVGLAENLLTGTGPVIVEEVCAASVRASNNISSAVTRPVIYAIGAVVILRAVLPILRTILPVFRAVLPILRAVLPVVRAVPPVLWTVLPI